MSDDRLSPDVLMYTGSREVLPHVMKNGRKITGDDARIYNANEFSRVMYESGLTRDETAHDYGRTTAYAGKPDAASDWQRHQAESATEAAHALDAWKIAQPFSADASHALLMILPDSLPDEFGNDGSATV